MKPSDRSEKTFALFEFAIKSVWVSIIVMGIIAVAIAVSGADWSQLDEHEIFQYRMVAAPVLIVGYLLLDCVFARRRAADDAALGAVKPTQPARGYQAEFIALALLVAGGAAFWHDHMNHEIPKPVAVAGQFVGATCVDGRSRVAVVGPHMAIGYEFPSQSTAVRASQVTCLLDKCEPEKPPHQFMDTAFKRVFYASLAQCQAALPDVVARKAPTTLWTGDKDLNASVRARFTPERDPPPYFLLWVPALVAGVVFAVSIVGRVRAKGNTG